MRLSQRPGPAAPVTVATITAALLVAACGQSGTAGTTPRSATPAASGQGASSLRTPAAAPFDPARVNVGLEPVTDIPDAPLAIAAPDDGSDRLFVAEQGGRIWIVRDGQRVARPFLDVSGDISAGGERGLLGLAFHPKFPEDPRFFIYYTNRDGDQVVAERRVAAPDADQAEPAERLLLVMDDFAGNHNGGALAFGPDGHLYIATGDGGGAGDPEGTGQRLDTPLGKILRIGVDPEGDRAYTIPDGNPLASRSDSRPEIWHLGLRNPWRFSFDRATGDLWIGDVGQGTWEEIDVARDGAAGLNFGWSVTEGPDCFREAGCSMDGLTSPVTAYGRDAGCTVIGGVVYRGEAWPALQGAYVFGDYCSGTVWAIDAAAATAPQPAVVAETGRSLSSFGEDARGEVYATDLGGELLRLTAPAR